MHLGPTSLGLRCAAHRRHGRAAAAADAAGGGQPQAGTVVTTPTSCSRPGTSTSWQPTTPTSSPATSLSSRRCASTCGPVDEQGRLLVPHPADPRLRRLLLRTPSCRGPAARRLAWARGAPALQGGVPSPAAAVRAPSRPPSAARQRRGAAGQPHGRRALQQRRFRWPEPA